MKTALEILHEELNVEDWSSRHRDDVIECMEIFAKQMIEADRQNILKECTYKSEGYLCLDESGMIFLAYPFQK